MSSQGQNRCLVCDDASIGLNFGVPTCMPCKAFFRRNALRLGVSQDSSNRFFQRELYDYLFIE
jgi:hypothetical protein